MPTQFSLSHFLASTDIVARCVLAILVLMSIITWTVILSRGWRQFFQSRRQRRFLTSFWRAPTLATARETLDGADGRNAFGDVARHGFAALAGLDAARREAATDRAGGASPTPDAQASEALIQRMLERGIAHTRRGLELGLGALASIASTAPFVGLFGTVWGIYQALIRIGQSGQGTLDKVAGPIGEALIMTAFGLVVAIPAVIAYNMFARRSRHLGADLEGFAGDLMALLLSGWKAPQLLTASRAAVPGGAAPAKPRPAERRLGDFETSEPSRSVGGSRATGGGGAIGSPAQRVDSSGAH